jgi:single stranded DNA-binding protein
MNIAILSGYLGRDPELRTVNGDQVLSFSIGVSVGPRDSQETMWVDCSIWGKRAVGLEPYLRKGMKVTVSGAIKLGEYSTKDGVIKSQLKMTVNEVELPPRGSSNEPEPVPVQSTPAPIIRKPSPSADPARTAAQTADPFSKFEDDIPF